LSFNTNLLIPKYLYHMRINVLADCLKTMLNAERAGRKQVMIRPASKVVIKFLKLMQKHSTTN